MLKFYNFDRTIVIICLNNNKDMLRLSLVKFLLSLRTFVADFILFYSKIIKKCKNTLLIHFDKK